MNIGLFKTYIESCWMCPYHISYILVKGKMKPIPAYCAHKKTNKRLFTEEEKDAECDSQESYMKIPDWCPILVNEYGDTYYCESRGSHHPIE